GVFTNLNRARHSSRDQLNRTLDDAAARRREGFVNKHLIAFDISHGAPLMSIVQGPSNPPSSTPPCRRKFPLWPPRSASFSIPMLLRRTSRKRPVTLAVPNVERWKAQIALPRMLRAPP